MSQNEERGKNERKTNENECKENVEIEKEEFEVKGENARQRLTFPLRLMRALRRGQLQIVQNQIGIQQDHLF